MNLDSLTDLVCRRLQCLVRARLIGKEPSFNLGFHYVRSEPYDAVVLGILPPGMLLRMPTDPVCRALLTGLPVYLWSEQPYRESEFCGSLQRELRRAEERLLSLGAVYLPSPNGWITGSQANWLKQMGIMPGNHSKLTPLAQEILEEKYDRWNSNR